jgi:hypothetical protein
MRLFKHNEGLEQTPRKSRFFGKAWVIRQTARRCSALALGGAINMNETDSLIEWHDGSGENVEIGYLNFNGQQCCGHCGVAGTDHNQYAYKTECTICGYVYGTNVYSRECRSHLVTPK